MCWLLCWLWSEFAQATAYTLERRFDAGELIVGQFQLLVHPSHSQKFLLKAFVSAQAVAIRFQANCSFLHHVSAGRDR